MRNDRYPILAALARLARFLAWYGLALLLLMWLLPSAGTFLQAVYDGLDAPARYALVAALIATLAAQGAAHYRRLRRARRIAHGSPENLETSS